MEEFAKAVHAFRFGPHDMFGGTARLFDTSQEGRYSFVYGDGETVWITMSDEDFLLLSGIWFLCEEIRLVWKENKKQRAKDDAGGKDVYKRQGVVVGRVIPKMGNCDFWAGDVRCDLGLAKRGTAEQPTRESTLETRRRPGRTRGLCCVE